MVQKQAVPYPCPLHSTDAETQRKTLNCKMYNSHKEQLSYRFFYQIHRVMLPHMPVEPLSAMVIDLLLQEELQGLNLPKEK